MKKIVLLCAAMVVAGLFTACDPYYCIDYSICNKSGHDVTIKSAYPSDNTLWDNNPDGITIKNGMDTMFCTTDGNGNANIVQAKADMKIWVYGDTVSFTFDDGKQLVYLRRDDDGVFDVESNHYSWSSEKDWMLLMRYTKYGHLTYTITEDEYNNAQ